MFYHQVLGSRELGGGGLVALRFAAFLEGQSRPSPVWIPGEGPAWDEAKRLGLQPRSYDLARASSPRSVPAVRANWQLSRRLRQKGPGLVHVNSTPHYGALRWGLRLSGLARVVHVQIQAEREAGFRWTFRDPPELIITCARFLVDYVRRTLPESHRDRQRIVAIPNTVDLEKFAPGDKQKAKERVAAPPGMPLAVMLANLAPHKGQETAIRAVALLRARGIALACWLAGIERGGQGSYRQRLLSLASDLGVADRVRLLGQRSDAPDLLRAADFFLLPSTCEGLPLSILEAQATRVPVLAAPTAGIPEAVTDGETGFLIAANDAAGYAHCLESLLANPDLYRRVAEAAYARTTRVYNWQSYCQRTWEAYEELLRSGIRSQGSGVRKQAAHFPDP